MEHGWGWVMIVRHYLASRFLRGYEFTARRLVVHSGQLSMRFEVEQKFPVSDLAVIERRLASWVTASDRRSIRSISTSPIRFAISLRLTRHCGFAASDTSALSLTRDQDRSHDEDSPRDRIAVGWGFCGSPQWRELLFSPGFRSVAEVAKRRRTSQVDWDGRQVEIALDEVAQLGSFVELEIAADEAEVESARNCLASLAAKLGLGLGERRSYLELLLGKARPPRRSADES